MSTNHIPRPGGSGPSDPEPSGSPVVHLYVLLDRSGSMATIASDVIGGFNQFLSEQAANGDDARMTLVQFDGQDPEEVVADAVPVREMTPLDAATFTPRSTTPLLDATGRILSRAAARQQSLVSVGEQAEQVVIVSITDGHENASCELTLEQVRSMVDDRTEDGWTFVFLSAALDVYGEANSLGYDVGASQSFSADAEGVGLAFHSLSDSARMLRDEVRAGVAPDTRDFFRGDKAAEADRRDKER